MFSFLFFLSFFILPFVIAQIENKKENNILNLFSNCYRASFTIFNLI
uniref:Uncharacterized protein n=1 Tax=Siphoviridae sp. ctCVD13 TaxID=2826194 RepID=A0A8S5MFL5_9CAUD|nr:MAG TPA: hypothetical protein [Siphoviridae sp. ctCVD13]